MLRGRHASAIYVDFDLPFWAWNAVDALVDKEP